MIAIPTENDSLDDEKGKETLSPELAGCACRADPSIMCSYLIVFFHEHFHLHFHKPFRVCKNIPISHILHDTRPPSSGEVIRLG